MEIFTLIIVVMFNFLTMYATNVDYDDHWDPIFDCLSCFAKMLYDERMGKPHKPKTPRFFLCCANEKIELPILKEAPTTLLVCYSKITDEANIFKRISDITT